MEHSINLAVGHFLSHVTPVHTTSAAKDNDDDDLAEDTAPSDDSSAIISNSLRKLLTLIKQVRLVCHIFCSH